MAKRIPKVQTQDRLLNQVQDNILNVLEPALERSVQQDDNGRIVLIRRLPTSPVGLPAGALWVDTVAGNVIKVVL